MHSSGTLGRVKEAKFTDETRIIRREAVPSAVNGETRIQSMDYIAYESIRVLEFRVPPVLHVAYEALNRVEEVDDGLSA